MANVVGHFWAQTVYWNSTSSTKSRIVELAGPRNITGPPQMHQGEEAFVHYHVDPNTRKLRIEPERDLIREAKRVRVVEPKARALNASKKKKKKKGNRSR
jgi:hypothetical protein